MTTTYSLKCIYYYLGPWFDFFRPHAFRVCLVYVSDFSFLFSIHFLFPVLMDAFKITENVLICYSEKTVFSKRKTSKPV